MVFILAVAIICAQTLTPQPVFLGGKTEYQIKSVKTEEKRVAITIDTAFGQTDHTREILAMLKEKGIPVTFAVMGIWAKEHPEEAREIAASRAEIISHSHGHERYDGLSFEKVQADAKKAREDLKQNFGVETNFIRVPYNACGKETYQALQEAGIVPIGFAVDAKDIESQVEEIVDRVTEDVKPGDILLFQNNNPNAAPAMAEVIERLESLGYRFETVSSLLGEEGYTVNNSGVAVPLESPAKS